MRRHRGPWLLGQLQSRKWMLTSNGDVEQKAFCLERKEAITTQCLRKKMRFMGGVRKTKNITFRTLSINYAHLHCK